MSTADFYESIEPWYLPVHIRAQDLRSPSILRLDVDIVELQPSARRTFAAVYACSDIIPRSTRDILPSNIADLESRAIAVLVLVDAWRNVDGLVHILELDVTECDVADVPLTRVRLDPGSVRGVDSCDVFKKDVVDVFGDAGRVSHRAYAHCSALVAGDVLDMDVAAIAFDGDTILHGTC